MKKQADYVTTSHFDAVIEKIFIQLDRLDKMSEQFSKLDKITEQLDWLVGKYRNHEEEHILLNGKVSEHSDRIEVIEKKLSIPA
jgi:hypothetical protein